MSDSHFSIQIISNSTLVVDVYFFLSGFLLAYVYLKGTMGKTGIKPINYVAKLKEFIAGVTKRFIRYVVRYLNSPGQ